MAFTTQKVILPPALVLSVESCCGCIQASFPAEQALLSARPVVRDSAGTRQPRAGQRSPSLCGPSLRGQARARSGSGSCSWLSPSRALCSALRRGKRCWEGWARWEVEGLSGVGHSSQGLTFLFLMLFLGSCAHSDSFL